MNPFYAISESPHRWPILAGLTFVVALFGTMMMFAYDAPHALAKVWLYLGVAVTLAFLWLAFAQWKDGIEEVISETEGNTGNQRPAPSVRSEE